MTSTRPYLIRAFYDWIVDNDCTPHIVVNAGFEGVEVPMQYVDGGQIVLNIAVSAVQGLKLGDAAVEFNARFGGKIDHVYAPVGSILAIYARENGRGMVFAEEEEADPSLPPPTPPKENKKISSQKEESEGGDKGGKGGKKGGKPHLTIVK